MERLGLRLPSPIKGPTRWLSTLLDLDDVLLKVLFGTCLGVDDSVVDVGVYVAGLGVCVVAIWCSA